VLSNAFPGQDGLSQPLAGGSWLPAALAVLVCFFLLGGTVLGFYDLILAGERADAYFLFPATCH
jgi:hypothetical protein